MYNFNILADRKNDFSRKWDKNVIEEKYNCLINDDFIPMWIADMDFEAPDFIIEALNNVIKKRSFNYTYTLKAFYTSIINWYKQKGIHLEKDWITLSYGTVSTLHNMVQAFSNEQDYIIINSPVYGPFSEATLNNNRKLIENNLIIKDNRYYIDFAKLQEQFEQYKPKIYILCNPHNPSGRIWSLAELNNIAELCAKYNVLLISDEVHSEQIISDKYSYTSLLQLDDKFDNIIVLTSPNKAFNLGGLKTSFSIIKNAKILEVVNAQYKKTHVTSPNIFSLHAFIASYEQGQQWLIENTAYIKNNCKYAINFINENIPQIKVMDIEASYLLWGNIAALNMNATEFCFKLAQEQSLLLEPGVSFGEAGRDFIRINLGTSQQILEAALKKLKTFVDNLLL